MRKESKEGKKNRWVISNVLYAFKCAWNCKKLYLVGMLLWAVTTALVGYVWQFAAKYVIEAIEKGWDAKTVIYMLSPQA
ncbi:MAG: hypothetical protein LUH08_07700 [Ruminococcus sp.]|nr:hypothetical protein [Ruminococcus sp.]